jgi:hypothetical protein
MSPYDTAERPHGVARASLNRASFCLMHARRNGAALAREATR